MECEKECSRNKNVIAELKRTIEHYRSLADLSPDCILIIDREFLIRYVNATAARYLGEKPDSILGRPFTRFFPPATYRALSRHLRQVFGSGLAVTSMDNVSFPDIRLLLNTKWVPLWDSSGNISSALCISRQIGTHKTASAESHRATGDAAHILSHREVQVLRLITDGMTNKEIAERLFISAKTVETHRARMMKKLDAHNAPALIRKSRQAGLVD
jgi:PAS domain S-box-containing protein